MVATSERETLTEKEKRARQLYDRYVDAAQHTGNQLWDWANQHTRSYIAYLAQAAQNFSTKGTNEAVIFGYWAVFSLFPLVTLSVVIATFALGPTNARTAVYSALERFVPGGGSELIGDNINQAIDHRGGFGIVGILGLMYGSVGLFTHLQWNLSRIFRDEKKRTFIAQILLGLAMMLVLAVLTIISIVASVLFGQIGTQMMGANSPVTTIGEALVPVALDALMFGLLFRFVPHRKIAPQALWPAALLAGIAWELSKLLFGWYVANLANFGVVYGSLGTVIGLLTWMYLTGCFVSLWGEVAVATDDWLARRAPAIAVKSAPINKSLPDITADEREHIAGPMRYTDRDLD